MSPLSLAILILSFILIALGFARTRMKPRTSVRRARSIGAMATSGGPPLGQGFRSMKPSCPTHTPTRPRTTTRHTSLRAFLDQAWGVSVDQKTLTETIPQQLFAFSIIPYAGFLYHLTKSKQAPKLTLFGFYFLLVFVFATIPAGIYAKKVYHTTLANVDYLHGSAEFLLTLTNLFIVIGLKNAIDEKERERKNSGKENATESGKEGRTT